MNNTKVPSQSDDDDNVGDNVHSTTVEDESRLAQKVAQMALHHYDKQLLQKGKPKENEWTVYAALLAVTSSSEEATEDIFVVSCATGTKCTALRNDGKILHDSHAEVLCRRGLLRVLWKEINQSQHETRRLLESIQGNKFRFRSDTQLHLYISDSPCGDASIYALSQQVQFTGAKLILSKSNGVSAADCSEVLGDGQVAREAVQHVGKLRSKSGRSNLDEARRSTSMSCSDKLVLWSAMGWQGLLLSHFIEDPIRVSSIIVSRDTRLQAGEVQRAALERAIPNRVAAATRETTSYVGGPAVHVIEAVFARGKAATESRKRKRESCTFSSCGMSINWQCCSQEQELVVGARGIQQGKKPKSNADYSKLQSRLCRAAMVEVAKVKVTPACATTYSAWKKRVASRDYQALKDQLLANGPLSGWLVGREGGDFAVKDDTSSV
jgi:tRNA-specific adenosine deaminase 1